MKQYIGTKIIQAEPMTKGAYNAFRGWKIPENENPADNGYLVKYPDGYVSWSPKDVFEEAYRQTDNMTFGLAIEAAKKGYKIARAGWNGKGMYVFLADDVAFHTEADISEFEGATGGVTVLPVLVMRTAQGDMCPGWLASQTDMLAEDWVIVA